MLTGGWGWVFGGSTIGGVVTETLTGLEAGVCQGRLFSITYSGPPVAGWAAAVPACVWLVVCWFWVWFALYRE